MDKNKNRFIIFLSIEICKQFIRDDENELDCFYFPLADKSLFDQSIYPHPHRFMQCLF